LTRNFRIEPRFGIYSFSNERREDLAPNQPEKDTYTLTNIGISIEYVIPTGRSFQFYAGPRTSLNFMSYSSSYYSYNGGTVPVNITATQTETDILISALFGAEYFPLSELSIGGEIDLNYVSFGNPVTEQVPTPAGGLSGTTFTRSLISTGALLFVRWYFL
jgi:hypothetical protein